MKQYLMMLKKIKHKLFGKKLRDIVIKRNHTFQSDKIISSIPPGWYMDRFNKLD